MRGGTKDGTEAAGWLEVLCIGCIWIVSGPICIGAKGGLLERELPQPELALQPMWRRKRHSIGPCFQSKQNACCACGCRADAYQRVMEWQETGKKRFD